MLRSIVMAHQFAVGVPIRSEATRPRLEVLDGVLDNGKELLEGSDQLLIFGLVIPALCRLTELAVEHFKAAGAGGQEAATRIIHLAYQA